MSREQVITRVSPEKKEEWREYAKDTHGSLTSLIEIAVDSYIEANGNLSIDTGEAGASGEAVTEVAEAIDRLENTVSDMDRRLSAVRESVDNSGGYSLKAGVRECLPVSPENPTDGYTDRQIAARLDARESDVRDTLDDLQQSGEVRSLSGGPENETYYFRQGGE